jgi:hypothetical protein
MSFNAPLPARTAVTKRVALKREMAIPVTAPASMSPSRLIVLPSGEIFQAINSRFPLPLRTAVTLSATATSLMEPA